MIRQYHLGGGFVNNGTKAEISSVLAGMVPVELYLLQKVNLEKSFVRDSRRAALTAPAGAYCLTFCQTCTGVISCSSWRRLLASSSLSISLSGMVNVWLSGSGAKDPCNKEAVAVNTCTAP